MHHSISNHRNPQTKREKRATRQRRRELRDTLRQSPYRQLRRAIVDAGGVLYLDGPTRYRLRRAGIGGLMLEAAIVALDRFGAIELASERGTVVIKLRRAAGVAS